LLVSATARSLPSRRIIASRAPSGRIGIDNVPT
jgi:hypothetical protein